jgi:hypothetical protein
LILQALPIQERALGFLDFDRFLHESAAQDVQLCDPCAQIVSLHCLYPPAETGGT